MTAKDFGNTGQDAPTAAGQDEPLQLLRRVDRKLDDMNGKLDRIRKEAIVSGATAGGLTGGIIAAGIALAKAKLGM